MEQTKDYKVPSKKLRKPEDPRKVELRRVKYEIAEELGLIDKIRCHGWTGLSAAECGMIGGKLGARMKQTQTNTQGNRTRVQTVSRT